MTPAEFKNWIKQQNVARTVLFVQQHHTFLPSYQQFRGDNHFSMQSGMKTFHMQNGWNDIAQHFSIYPDGKVVTGRSLEAAAACIKGNNANAICIENIGDFDTGKDQMNNQQRESILTVTAALCERFGIPVNTDRIVYHHWFDLNTMARTNGSGNTKSCPGTNFFGGNKVSDCENNFLPGVRAKMGQTPTDTPNITDPMSYGYVTANALNIRKGPGSSNERLGVTTLGSILRIYLKQGRWYKISKSKQEWVYGNYVKEVQRATVNANVLNVRSGPSTNFNPVGTVMKNQEVFVYEQQGNWSRISLEDRWVSTRFLDLR